MRINIIGAGMSVLLAANMLRRHDIALFERQENLPNNHHAVLRFRTPNVGDVLGIQFKKVNMIKTYVPYSNIAADSLSYSRKCTGVYRSDRSIIAGTVIEERYVAPLDLIEQMSKNVDIKYGSDYNFKDSKTPCISTIPMPILMDMLEYDSAHNIGFDYKPGKVLTGRIGDCDAYISVLFPDPNILASRATITGDQLIIEYPNNNLPEAFDIACVYPYLGLGDCFVTDVEIKTQIYFKITEINDAERKKFQRWATVNHNIYSLGRYATWRPKLLLDDLVNDVRKIEKWIQGGKI
jgi:hypothetical protein